MVSNQGNVVGLVRWQMRNVLLYAAAGGVAAGVHVVLGWEWMRVPVLPLSVVGAAIGIFVSFRTNSAYDRWWEGRKLWGQLVNTSRMFSSQIRTYAGSEPAISERLILRHLAYVHTLRCLLRSQNPSLDAEVLAVVPPEDLALLARSNATHALLHRQQEEVVALHRAGVIDAWMLQSLDRSLGTLLDVQGGCERIKRTPLPRGYGFIAESLVQYFSLLFPFAVAPDLGLMVIPANILVCLSFALISEAGRVLEDPFTVYWNGLPLSALSRTIEINLREVLGHPNLPPALVPDADGILM
jgi:putative membrane protein